MSKRGKIYIFLTIFAIFSIVALEYTKPKEVNWFPSYVMHHKIPLGTYVFKNLMEKHFNSKTLHFIDKPPFESLDGNSEISGTYIFINDQVSFGDVELERILAWTAEGNTLVIASSDFDEALLDTLHLEISAINNFDNEFLLQLKHNNLSKNIFHFEKANYLNYYSKVDTLQTKIIGVIDNLSIDETTLGYEHINVIKQKFGEGNIVLSTFPQAFSNYFVLNAPNQEYLAGLMSYFSTNQNIYLDQYYKSGKSYYTSPLYLLLNTKELKWAYYLLLIGALLYILFEGKRKQRAIPIVRPLKNQTIEFTRTIADMYYEKEKHKEISDHKINHFFDYIRSQLHLNTQEINNEFIKQLAARSNNDVDETKGLLKTINAFKNKIVVKQEELEALNASIEKFKSKNIWKTKN